MAEPSWRAELNRDETGWWVVGPADSPEVRVMPYQHIGHAPTAEDFQQAAAVVARIVAALNEPGG